MAEESVVLLKNENQTLPLSSDSKAGVYGVMAETMQYGQYSSELDVNDEKYNTYVQAQAIIYWRQYRARLVPIMFLILPETVWLSTRQPVAM